MDSICLFLNRYRYFHEGALVFVEQASANYLSKRIWQKHVVNYVVNNFSPDIIHMRNNIPFALYHLRKMNKLVFLEFYDVPTKFYLDIYKKAIVGNKNLIS